jgi:hypothetical protein
MRTGKVDPTQLAAGYSAQLTEQSIQTMSRYFGQYKYGASPIETKLLLTRSVGDQNFYVVKLFFPRLGQGW